MKLDQGKTVKGKTLYLLSTQNHLWIQRGKNNINRMLLNFNADDQNYYLKKKNCFAILNIKLHHTFVYYCSVVMPSKKNWSSELLL